MSIIGFLSKRLYKYFKVKKSPISDVKSVACYYKSVGYNNNGEQALIFITKGLITVEIGHICNYSCESTCRRRFRYFSYLEYESGNLFSFESAYSQMLRRLDEYNIVIYE